MEFLKVSIFRYDFYPGPFYLHGSTVVLASIAKFCIETPNQLRNFNGSTIEVWEWIGNIITHFTGLIHAVIHYCDVIMGAMASQITSLAIVYTTVCSSAD